MGDLLRLPGFKKRQLDVPIEGTENTLWPQAASFFDNLQWPGGFFSPRLAEHVWVAERCSQLNSQQISTMELKFLGSSTEVPTPAWVSNPDPTWFNNISDAVFRIVRNMYGWGYAILVISSRYSNGFPQAWAVAEPETVFIDVGPDGRRRYKINNVRVDWNDVVQIDRNPGGLHGTSALRAFTNQAWGVIYGGRLTQNTMGSGGIPQSVIKADGTVTPDQAKAIQEAYLNSGRPQGAPAVFGKGLDFEVLSFSPKDLLLLDAQKFNALAVAAAFGVPGVMLNIALEGALVYQNPQTLGEFLWRFELRSMAKRIADSMTAKMLPRGNAVFFESSDTWAPLTEQTNIDDSAIVNASPADAGTVTPIRPEVIVNG